MQQRFTLPALAGGFLSLLCPFQVLAEPDWIGDPIIVTASRTAQSTDRVPARVSVIDRADIERSQAPDLLELLRLQAGVDLSRAGGPGAQTSLFMRGANSNQVLVLIDGVRVAASGTGAFTWETLDPALIERIEIVRGPRAARWGSDAVGGVIQIFTRRGPGAQASVAYGSDRERAASVAAGLEHASLAADAALAWRKVGGFSAQNERGFAFDPDDDGFENLSLATGGQWAHERGELRWRGRLATGDIEFDQGESDFENWSWRFDYLRETAGPWRWQAGLATLRDELDTETAFGVSEVRTRRLQGDWLAERAIGGGQSLLIGIDGWRESGVSRNQWSDSRYNFGAFVGLDGSTGAWAWEASVRLDENENFGTEPTGSAGLQYRPAEAWRVFANAGRAFRAPSFSQLFSPGFGGLFAGNPDLDPERSWSAEMGADFNPTPGQRFTFSLFSNWIDDLIDFSGENFQAVNVRQSRIRGLEFTHDLAAGPWSSRFNLTWQDPEDRDLNRDLLRRAEFKGSWVLGYQSGQRWNLDAELVHVGDRLDVGAARLSSYTLVNLRAAWRWTQPWEIEIRVDNLADRKYEPLFGFNAADRRVFVRLVWGN